MTDQILDEAKHKMAQAVAHAREELAKVRTGRANPGLIADLPVDYYGTPTPMQQVAGISVPEPRQLLISPYDPAARQGIEKAIRDADLGLNPNTDGEVIRVHFPELSEERRKEYVRYARERAEEGRVAVRNIRRQAKADIEQQTKDGDIAEDEGERAERTLQRITDEHVAQIDGAMEAKQQELLEV